MTDSENNLHSHSLYWINLFKNVSSKRFQAKESLDFILWMAVCKSLGTVGYSWGSSSFSVESQDWPGHTLFSMPYKPADNIPAKAK